MVREKKGNLLEAKENIIAHQVNCIGVMGAGVAKQIRDKVLTRQQYEKYQELCNIGGATLLGHLQIQNVTQTQEEKFVANLFGENIPTGKGLDTNYLALEKALRKLQEYAERNKLSVALPGYLGCGLAGGNWDIVYSMIDDIFQDTDVTVYYINDSIQNLWKDFGDVPMDPKTECIEENWHCFKAGTHREEIWQWFEDTFEIPVHDLMFPEW